MANHSLWNQALNGPTTSADDGQPISVGTEVRATAPCWVTHLHYWRADAAQTGPVPAAVFNAATGNPLAGTEVTFPAATELGWQTVALPAPVALPTGGERLVPTVLLARYSAIPGYWTVGDGASGIASGPLLAPSSAAITDPPTGQGRYSYGASLTSPQSTFQGGNYLVDLTVTDTEPAPDTITPDGIAATGGPGTPAVAPGPVTVAPAGIAPAGGPGAPALAPGAVTVAPAGIAPAGAPGTPTVAPGPAALLPAGIAATGGPGAPALTPGPATVTPGGIAPTGAPGSLTLGLSISPAGAAPTGGPGTPALTPGAVIVAPAGIAPAGGAGAPGLRTSGVTTGLRIGRLTDPWRVGPLQN